MGQWIDVVGAARQDRSPERARWVATYKSGRYTIKRLHLGATLAGRPDLLDHYSAFGSRTKVGLRANVAPREEWIAELEPWSRLWAISA